MKKNRGALVPTKEIADKRDAKQLWRNNNEQMSRNNRRVLNEMRRQQRKEEAIERAREDPNEGRMRFDDNDYDDDTELAERMDEMERILSDEDMPLATKLALTRRMKRKPDEELDHRTTKRKRNEETNPQRVKSSRARAPSSAQSTRKRPVEEDPYESDRRKVFLLDEDEEREPTVETEAQNNTPIGNELDTLDRADQERFEEQQEETPRFILDKDRRNVHEKDEWKPPRGNRDSDAPLIRMEDMIPNTSETESAVNFGQGFSESLPQLPQSIDENKPRIRQQKSSVNIFRPVVESVFKRPPQPTKSTPEPLVDLQHGFSVDLPTIAFASYTQRLNLRRVLLVLNATAPVNAQTQSRKWLGIKTFFNYYFGSSLKLFLGKRSVVRIFLISSQNDLCAKLYRLDGGGRYVLTIVANFDYWNSLVELADALPDVYFRSNCDDIARTYLRQLNQVPLSASVAKAMREPIANRVSSAMLQSYTSDSNAENTDSLPPESRVVKNVVSINGQEVEIKRGSVNAMYSTPTYSTIPNLSRNDDAQTDRVNETFSCDREDDHDGAIDQAVSGLCLAHLIEMLIEKDLKSKVPNYVTLGQLFSGDKSTINPFKIQMYTR